MIQTITSSASSGNLRLWWRIIRPKTLFASICPVIAAGLLLFENKDVEYIGVATVIVFIVTLLSALSLQVLSNLINDYYDFKKGSDKKGRVGFKRALAEGLVTPLQMKKAIYITLGVAVLTGALLVVVGGLPIVLIGISAIVFAWLYTATSHSLSYLGIADVFCFLYYGVFAVLGAKYLVDCTMMTDTSWLWHNTASVNKSTLCVGAICGMISMMVLMINNLRDIEDDKAVNKKTIPVRFGKKFGESLLLMYSIFVLSLSFYAFGLSFTNLLFIPFFVIYQKITVAQGDTYNQLLFKSGQLNLLFVLLLALEILI